MRYRNRSQSFTLGTAKWLGGGSVADRTSFESRIEDCWDIVGNPTGQNPFELERTSNLLYTVHGTDRIGASLKWNYNGWGSTSTPGSHLAATDAIPSDNDAFSIAIARGNPNRPYVDLPVFGAELKDIPGLVKHGLHLWKEGYGRYRTKDIRRLLREAGSDHLTVQFGLKPIAEDLMKMMDFTNQVERRVRLLQSMYLNKGGVTRSTKVWENTAKFAVWRRPLSNFYAEGNSIDCTWHTERSIWCSTVWKLEGNIPVPSDSELRGLANRLVFGQYASFDMIYELMPWSWLVDWFSNVGDLVKGSRNYLPVSHSGSCLMSKTNTRLVTAELVVPNPHISVSKAPSTRIHLKRTVLPDVPLPEARIPFLNPRQLSILSALAVTRI